MTAQETHPVVIVTTNPQITHIQQALDRIGATLCGVSKPDFLFSITNAPTISGKPHLEIVDDIFHFVNTVRGVEIGRRSTKDIDELLYWIVSGDTAYLARDWQIRQSDDSQTTAWFEKQLELLHTINPAWAERKRLEHTKSAQQ